MMLITPNSNEDSQGTQLRIGKKLTTVCSGKRSRFSKPRPNLAISKRGESNVLSNASKTSKNHETEVVPNSLSLNTDSKGKTLNEDIQNHQPIEIDIDEKKVVNEDIQKQLPITNIKIKVDDIKEVLTPPENVGVLDSEDIEVISDDVGCQISNAKEISPDEDHQLTSDTNVEKSSPDEDIEIISNIDLNSASKENNIQTNPLKNSGSPLKNLDSEKRNISNATPTIIDKSKYPHLTSILSKKRTEPRKEVQQKRRKKFKKGDAPPERSKMTMADLIYWNPAKTDEPPKSTETVNETTSINIIAEEDNIGDDDVENENNILDSVPKLVISEDGQIDIDQSSLFVSRNVPQPISTEIIRKDDTTYSSFRKRPLTKHWTDKDTANFYRALSLVGADFSLMEQIFPNRTRRELKQKFKREEKFNIDLINKVLYESQTFDELTLNDFIDQNNAVDDPVLVNEKDAQDAVKDKSRKKRTTKRKSTDVTCDSSEDHLLLESAAENNKPVKNKSKKKKAKNISDDEDIEMLIADFTNDGENIDERKGSKRKRNIKKLPDDFIDLDSIHELDVWTDDESNSQEEFENVNTSENQGSNTAVLENYVEEIVSESACDILDKIMNGAESTDNQPNLEEETHNATETLSVVTDDNQQNLEKETQRFLAATEILPEVTKDAQQNSDEKIGNTTDTLPLVTNDNEEYISVEYIKNDDLSTDLSMLQTVVAYEVVNTQTAAPKRRRKINAVPSLKTRDYFLTTKITPTNYTNYTPV